MRLNQTVIREQIATIDQVVGDLIYRDSLSPGELENFLDLLSPLVAELDQVRGNLLVDLNAQISRLQANEDAINDLKEEIQDFKEALRDLNPNDPGYAEEAAAAQANIRDRQEDIKDLYPPPAPGRHIAPALFDNMAWTIITGQTLLRRFARFLALHRTLEEPAFRSAVRAPLGWASGYAGMAGDGEDPAADEAGADADTGLVESLAEMRRKVRSLYSERAYSRLSGSALLKDWQARIGITEGTFERLSRRNLNLLRQELDPLEPEDNAFIRQFSDLPWFIKHATSESGIQVIADGNVFLSKVGLHDWTPAPHLLESGYTLVTDELEKQDIDFIFFRVELGDARMAETQYGNAQIAYPLEWILENGWITLHDMLQPISSSRTLGSLKTRAPRNGPDGNDPIRVRTTFGEFTNAVTPPWWEHFFHDPASWRASRKVSIMEEIFFKQGIIEGMTLSVLRDLKDMPTLKTEVYQTLGDQTAFEEYMRWLFPKLYRIEAKYPAYFNYDTAGRRNPSPT